MHIPNPHDATSYYRAMPLTTLGKTYPNDFNLDYAREISFSVAMKYHLAFFQRPSTGSELEAIKIFKRLGIPVIVDYDDLLFSLPTDNPAYQAYMNKQTQETIISIMRAADCIWVSTKELKRCIQLPHASLNEKVFVIPNCLDDTHLLIGDKKSPPEKRTPSVLWRGSPTHERDVMEYAREITECSQDTRYSFVFAGWNPWFLTDVMKQNQAMVSGALPVGEFMDFIYGNAPRIGMVPLHDSRFNRCKSNIAWLEMTWAGAAVLAPDWEEWKKPGITTYSNSDDFKIGLQSLLQSHPDRLLELNKMSWDHIQENFILSKVNHLRMDTIRATLGKNKWPNGWQNISDDDVMELE